MINCERCGKKLESREMYKIGERKLCEICAIEESSLSSPSKPCGPNRIH